MQDVARYMWVISMELAHVLLAYRIWRWFLGFWKIREPRAYMAKLRCVVTVLLMHMATA